MSYENLSATFKTNLVSPGDSIEYIITVTNSGSINAKLDKITLSESTNEYITFETNGLTEGSTLSANGGTATLTIKVTYKDIASGQGQPSNLAGSLKVTLDYVQNDEKAPETFNTTVHVWHMAKAPFECYLKRVATGEVIGTISATFPGYMVERIEFENVTLINGEEYIVVEENNWHYSYTFTANKDNVNTDGCLEFIDD